MGAIELPASLVERFRSSAFDRLARIETAWSTLARDSASDDTEADMKRELHTLKGEARVMGFASVALICEKFEDLVAAAQARRYRVGEDVDIVATMALQFTGMLLRSGTSRAHRRGIDLDGFIAQLDEVVRELSRPSAEPEEPAMRGSLPSSQSWNDDSQVTRIPGTARHRLASVATATYLESRRATDPATRARIHGLWLGIAREVAALESVPIEATLQQHVTASLGLASELGKEIDVSVDAGDTRVGAELLDVISTAVLHTLRNAVDHGIESAEARVAQQKKRRGSIRVLARQENGRAVLTISDDGAGIDLDALRLRAAASGTDHSHEELVNLVFVAGLSTRDDKGPVSGRGVGMDAVRSAAEKVGGEVTLTTTKGRGTTVTVAVPQASHKVALTFFPGTAPDILFAVDDSMTVTAAPLAKVSADLARLLSLPGGPAMQVLALESAGRRIFIAAGAVSPSKGHASRRCRTEQGDLSEIVTTPLGEAILLRWDALLAHAL